MARLADDVAPVEADAAGARAMHAVDGPDERALPGPVRADDRHDLALFHLERHPVERLRIAVEEVEPFDLQHQETASVPR